MKKIFYLLVTAAFLFTACKKEQGCMDSVATNYNADAEEDDGSCLFAISGGTWTTQSVGYNGTITISMMGIPILDSTINYIETNPDSLEPYKYIFEENNNYTEYDQSNNEVEGGTWSMAGDQLTIKRFQQLGLHLGFSDGMATLNYLFEKAFINKDLSYSFLKNVLSLQTFDTNPIFSILHESCYAQNFSTDWAANRILGEFPEFEIDRKDEIYFTGEMIYPWMLDKYQSLAPFKKAANFLAEKSDWPMLYDEQRLKNNKVPIAAAVYTNDMYVDREYSMETASIIPNISIWETDIFEHNALRSNGEKVLDSLFSRVI